MSIAWSKQQRRRVNAAIRAYPVDSGECLALARRLHTTAREVDNDAGVLHITPPPPERRIRPVGDLPSWAYHVTTTASAHCVDALTRAEGVPEEGYFVQFFESPETLCVERTMPWTVRP